MDNSIYDQVTQSIIDQLENGAAPWIKPWNGVSLPDKNIVSQKPYQGINRVILGMLGACKGYSVPVWGSFKQWQGLGGNVRKGEKGTRVVFYSPIQKENKDTGEIENFACLKTYWVFNVAQVDGISIVSNPDTPKIEFDPVPAIEDRIVKTGAIVRHGGNAAFYSPSSDYIQLPDPETFKSRENYYATAFHELVHWSGADSRLDRDLSKGRFGNADYAFEELVAEMGAAFMCADYAIQGDLRHAGYIESWLKCLKNNNKAVFKAAALAQKAADYLNSLDATAMPLAA